MHETLQRNLSTTSPDGSMIFDADDIADEGPPAGPTAIAIAVPVDMNDVSSSNNSEGLIGDTPIAIVVADDMNDVSSSNNNSAGLAGNNAIAIAVADDTNDVSSPNNYSAGLAGNNAIAIAQPISSNEAPSSPVVRETLGGWEDFTDLSISSNEVPSSPVVRETLGGWEDFIDLSTSLSTSSNEVPSSPVVRETIGGWEDFADQHPRAAMYFIITVHVGICALFSLWMYAGFLLGAVHYLAGIAWIFGPMVCICCCVFLSVRRGGVT